MARETHKASTRKKSARKSTRTTAAKTKRSRASKTHASAPNPMWGGGFSAGATPNMQAINNSLAFDRRLWQHDIIASLAHVEMLKTTKILSASDCAKIKRGLSQITREFESDSFPFDESLEDIHMNIEARLATIIGAQVAGRLHTARSRNDQAVTDLRLWLREACNAIDSALQNLQAVLIKRAKQEATTPLPAYTHQQRAQVISLGHWCLSWVEALGRDRERFADTQRRINRSPLGAAACAGTGFPIRPEQTAKTLGFDAPLANALDAVAARDFALEYLSACAICATTLSRLGAELVLWSSAEYGFVAMHESWSSGSSIMPQKRNPDAAELLRAKAGRVIGDLTALLTTVKGLPLAYAKDLQEDKEPLFDATDTLLLCLKAGHGMLATCSFKRTAMAEAAHGFLSATDLADYLVRKQGLPFRECHKRVSALVAEAQKTAPSLDTASDSALARCLGWKSAKSLTSQQRKELATLRGLLSVKAGLEARNSFAGTAPKRVQAAAAAAEKKFLGRQAATQQSKRQAQRQAQKQAQQQSRQKRSKK